jgi:hypothetical protein
MSFFNEDKPVSVPASVVEEPESLNSRVSINTLYTRFVKVSGPTFSLFADLNFKFLLRLDS